MGVAIEVEMEEVDVPKLLFPVSTLSTKLFVNSSTQCPEHFSFQHVVTCIKNNSQHSFPHFDLTREKSNNNNTKEEDF